MGGRLRPAPALYDLARLYAQAAAATKRDGALRQTEQAQLGGRYAVRAIELPTQARVVGNFNGPARVVDMRLRPDLDPLRSRPDFRKLLQEVEVKVKPGAK